MRNLKKMFAVVLTVAMIVTMFVTPAMAEGTDVSANASLLEDLKVVQGTGDGVTAEYLTTVPTREQAALMLLRLKGLEADARAFTGTENFADAGILTAQWETWGNILAYLKANPEVGFEGIGGNEFGVGQEMSAKAYTKVLLVGLGYEYNVDFTWDTVFSKAASVGLVELFDKATFTMDDLCDSTVEALKTNKKGEEVTLASALAEAGAIDAETAETVGLITPVPTPTPVALGVESVTAINLKQLEIVFNTPVDEDTAEDEDNYEEKGKSLDGKYELQDDGVTVIATLDKKVDNQTKKDITITGVKDADGKVIEKAVIEDVEFKDMTIPTVENAEVVGSDTVKVTFSEPMNADTSSSSLRKSFSLKNAKGNKIYVSKVTMESNNTVAKVKFYTDFKQETYAFTVENEIEDYAGYTVVKTPFDLEVEPDEDGPEIIDFKDAKPYSITLIFNEDIAFCKSTPDKGDFYHTNSKNEVKSGGIEIEGNELKYTFDSSSGSFNTKMPPGTVYLYVAKEAIKDLWGNKNSQQLMYSVEITSDTDAPVIKKVEATSQRELKVEFDEDLDSDEMKDKSNYELLDSDGDKINNIIRSIGYSGSDKDKIIIKLKDDISGTYTLVIDDVEDLYGNAMDNVSYEFTADDAEKPAFKDFSAEVYDTKDGFTYVTQKLIIDFDEAMATSGDYSVLDLEKYTVLMNKKDGTTWESEEYVNLASIDDGVSISSTDSDKKVEIEIDVEDAGYKIYTDASTKKGSIKIGRVADSAGNKTDDYGSTLAIDNNTDVTFEADKFEAVAKDKLELTLKARLSDEDDEDYILYYKSGSTDVVINDSFDVAWDVNSDGNSVVVFTPINDKELNADGTFKVSTDRVIFVKTKSSDVVSEDENGRKLAITEMKLKDKIGPSLLSKEDLGLTKTDHNQLTLTFDENLKADLNDSLIGLDLIVTADNEVLKAGIDYKVDALSTSAGGGSLVPTATLTLINDFRGFDGTISVDSADSPEYLKDVEGNKIEDFDEVEDEFAFSPEIKSVELVNNGSTGVEAGDQIVIKFTEEINASTINPALANGGTMTGINLTNFASIGVGDFAVKFTFTGGTNPVIEGSAELNSDGDKLTITITDYNAGGATTTTAPAAGDNFNPYKATSPISPTDVVDLADTPQPLDMTPVVISGSF